MNLVREFRKLKNNHFINSLPKIISLIYTEEYSDKITNSIYALHYNTIFRFFSRGHYDHSKVLLLIKLSKEYDKDIEAKILSVMNQNFLSESKNTTYFTELNLLLSKLPNKINFPAQICESNIFFTLNADNDLIDKILNNSGRFRFIEAYAYFFELKKKGYALQHILSNLGDTDPIHANFIKIILLSFNTTPYEAINQANDNLKPIILKLIT